MVVAKEAQSWLMVCIVRSGSVSVVESCLGSMNSDIGQVYSMRDQNAAMRATSTIVITC